MENIDTLIFSGGAMKCVCILGVLKYLFEKNIIKPNFDDINDFYFVSGSSIYMTPLLIGFSLESTIDLFKKLDYKKIYEDSGNMKIQNLFDNFGLKDISDFKYIAEIILSKKNIEKSGPEHQKSWKIQPWTPPGEAWGTRLETKNEKGRSRAHLRGVVFHTFPTLDPFCVWLRD